MKLKQNSLKQDDELPSLNSSHKSGKPYKQGVPGLFLLLCYYIATNRNYSISHRFVS